MASLEKSETLATLDPWSVGNDLGVTGGQSRLRSVPALQLLPGPSFVSLLCCFPGSVDIRVFSLTSCNGRVEIKKRFPDARATASSTFHPTALPLSNLSASTSSGSAWSGFWQPWGQEQEAAQWELQRSWLYK